MTIMVLKLVLAPLLVVTCTLVGRRWGQRVAGTLITLPVVAGPILLIVHLTHGPAFAAQAAGASLLGLISVALFALVFATVARRHGWPLTLAASWAAVLLADLGLSRITLPPIAALAVALLAIQAAAFALRHHGPIPPTPPSWPWWDLPARAAATAVLVLAVTGPSASFGPTLTGVLAPFPIAVSVICGFLLAQSGPAAAVSALRGILAGLTGFAAFCFSVAILLSPLGAPAAFATATAIALVTPTATTLISRSVRARNRVLPSADGGLCDRPPRRSG